MKKVSLPPDILRGQVISKVHWGTSDEEVIQFLETEHGISGNDADTLLTEAHAVRRKEIRSKAILGLLFSGTGLAISITYFAIQFFGGFILNSAVEKEGGSGSSWSVCLSYLLEA